MDNWRPPHIRYERLEPGWLKRDGEKAQAAVKRWEANDAPYLSRRQEREVATQRMKPKSLNDAEPPPKKNDHPGVWTLVMADMAQRDIEGMKKYNTRLQGFNGRDALVDAYQEALDLAVYLRQAIYERDNK